MQTVFPGADHTHFLAGPEKHLKAVNAHRKNAGCGQAQGRTFAVQEDAFPQSLNIIFIQTGCGAFFTCNRTIITGIYKFIQRVHNPVMLKFMPAVETDFESVKRQKVKTKNDCCGVVSGLYGIFSTISDF
jgi:hypothetical protein